MNKSYGITITRNQPLRTTGRVALSEQVVRTSMVCEPLETEADIVFAIGQDAASVSAQPESAVSPLSVTVRLPSTNIAEYR